MTHYERIKELVHSSKLEETDKKSITDVCALVADENLADIADLFTSKPEWIGIFNDVRKKKNEAYKAGDEAKWTEIIEQEKKYLQDLTYGLD